MQRERTNQREGSSESPEQLSGTDPISTDNRNRRIHNLPALTTFRKDLRNRLTPAEAKLWSLLKGSCLGGRKFRRQHSVGPYVLDFYCPAERLAVELDGQSHNSETAVLRDRERDLFLNEFGIKVLRFENKLVFEATEAVLIAIRNQFGWSESSSR